MAATPRVGLLFRVEKIYDFGLGLMRGIFKYVELHGPWHYHVAHADDSWEERLKHGELDGLLVFASHSNQKFIDAMNNSHLPCVEFGGTGTTRPVAHIIPDDIQVGRVAAQHFLDRGFSHFGFCGFYQAPHSDQRLAGFRQVLHAAGFDCDVYVDPLQDQRPWQPYHEYDPWSENLLGDWASRLPKPVGILAATDIRARQLVINCMRRGVAVPEQVAVLGVDNAETICQAVIPSISSVPLDGEKSGFEAARLLVRMMQGEETPNHPVMVPPLPVVTRRSTDMLAVPDPDVASAVRFIRQHDADRISVRDVVNAVTVSRRALELKFRQYIGHTILDELWRVHVNRAQRLLVDTNLSIGEIAETAGFRNAQAFSEMFHRQVKLSPSQFRRQFHRI